MEDFAGVQVFTGQELKPIGNVAQAQTGSVATDQARAIAEIQAAMTLARMNPRDMNRVMDKIKKACARPTLAEQAQFAFKRGTEIVSGPSIRLAEVLANSWGNMQYGLREVSRTNGSSEVEAYCWDLENNVKAIRSFQARHIRNTRKGSYNLTDERDIYELVANLGQRRVRACILELIDADIVEEAERLCDVTLKAALPGNLAETIKKMVEAFGEYGITGEQIEAFLGHNLAAIQNGEIVRLKKVFRSLKDGMAKKEEFFPPVKPVDNPTAPTTKENVNEASTTTQAAPAAPTQPEAPAAPVAPQATTSSEPAASTAPVEKAVSSEQPAQDTLPLGGSSEPAAPAAGDTISTEEGRKIMSVLNNLGVTVAAFRQKFGIRNIKDLKKSQLEEYKTWLTSEVDKKNA